MQKNISRAPRTSNRKYINFINDAYKGEGFTVPHFDYQKSIFSRLLWTSKQSVVRIVPGNDGSNTLPQVINADIWSEEGDQSDYLSDTFFMTYTVSRFGQSGFDIISQLDPNSEDAAFYPESPINFFTQAVNRTMLNLAKGKKTHWKPIGEWKAWAAMNGCCPFPRITLMFQALTFTMNGRTCKASQEEDAEEAPLYGVLGINNNSSIAALENALVSPMDRRKPIGSNNNTYGPLAEAKGNILYLNPAVKDNKHYLAPSIQDTDVPSNQWEPTPYDLPEDLCKDIWVPWDKILKYLSAKEQIELIADEFGADTVNYIFGQDPAWSNLEIPDRIASVGLNRYAQTNVKAASKTLVRPPIQKQPAPVYEAEPTPQVPHKLPGAANDMLNKINAATSKPKAMAAKLRQQQEVDVSELMRELDE